MKEFKVSFSAKAYEEISVLAVTANMTPHEFVRDCLAKEVKKNISKVKYKSLRYVEQAAIIMEYVDSDFSISGMSFNNLTEQAIRVKVISAANALREYSGSRGTYEGLKSIKDDCAFLANTARRVVENAKFVI